MGGNGTGPLRNSKKLIVLKRCIPETPKHIQAKQDVVIPNNARAEQQRLKFYMPKTEPPEERKGAGNCERCAYNGEILVGKCERARRVKNVQGHGHICTRDQFMQSESDYKKAQPFR